MNGWEYYQDPQSTGTFGSGSGGPGPGGNGAEYQAPRERDLGVIFNTISTSSFWDQYAEELELVNDPLSPALHQHQHGNPLLFGSPIMPMSLSMGGFHGFQEGPSYPPPLQLLGAGDSYRQRANNRSGNGANARQGTRTRNPHHNQQREEQQQELQPSIGTPWHMYMVKEKVPPQLGSWILDKTEFRKKMPVFKHRDEILQAVSQHRLTIVTGRSGLGKSTQIPQYLMEQATLDSQPIRILHSSPHAITPIVLSERVAAQRGELVGGIVGYQIFLESVQSPVETILTFCSATMLLRSLRAPDYFPLRHTSYLILDDVDERDAHTEFLLFMVKQLIDMPSYQDLRIIIIMNSDGLDEKPIDAIGNYFLNPLPSFAVVEIEKVVIPLPEIEYISLPLRNYNLNIKLSHANQALYNIHTSKPLDQGILVYVPNYTEMLALKDSIFHNHYFTFDSNSYVIYMVHRELQRSDLQIIFNGHLLLEGGLEEQKAKTQARRIILSLSVLESSLSIYDVNHIIDFGNNEVKYCGPGTAISFTSITPISKSSAIKRLKLGSAETSGIGGGTRVRMYSEDEYDNMRDKDMQEIILYPLQEFCLLATALTDEKENPEQIFEAFLTQPSKLTIKSSFDMLKMIGAIFPNGNITNLGAHLLNFPVEPRFAKALLYGVVWRCIDPVLTIVAAMASRDPFARPRENPEKMNAFKKFQSTLAGSSMSDHFVILRAFQEWERQRAEDGLGLAEDASYHYNNCYTTGSGGAEAGPGESLFDGFSNSLKEYILDGTFEIIYSLRTALLAVLRAAGFVKCKGKGDIKSLNDNSHNWAIVKASMLVALYPNVLKMDSANKNMISKDGTRVKIHPDSCISSFEVDDDGVLGVGTKKLLPSHWAIYDQLEVIEGEYYARGVTVINSAALALFGGSQDYEPRPYPPGSEPSPTTDSTRRGRRATRGRRGTEMEPWNPELAFKLDFWIGFKGPADDINSLLSLRSKVRHMINNQLEKPGVPYLLTDETYVRLVVLFLSHEDFIGDFKNVQGLGRWPKFAGGNMLSAPRMGYERAAFSSSSSIP